MSGNLDRRLAKIEQQLAEIARQANAANCICKDMTIISSEEEEAEMNRKCPVHEHRQDQFLIIRIEDMGDMNGNEVKDTDSKEL